MFARPIAPRRWWIAALAAPCVASPRAALAPASPQEPKEKEKAKAKAKAQPAPLDLPPKTLADVPYGDHPREVLDFWKAESNGPAPLAVFIHGGGWNGGDKSRPTSIDVKKLLQ